MDDLETQVTVEDPMSFITEIAAPVANNDIVHEPSAPDVKEKDKARQFKELKTAKEKAEAELRKAQDELKKAQAEKAEISSLSALKPIAEYIKNKSGDINEDAVNNFINKNRERKKLVEEAELKIKEKDELLKEISVDYSDDFKKGYVEPLQKEKNNLVALIANINNEGAIKHPKLIESLFNRLTQVDQEGKPLNAIQVKSVIAKFESEYRSKTQEDYDVPNVSHVVNQIETVVGKTFAAINAKKSWAQTKEEIEKNKLFESAKQESERLKKETDGRNYVTRKLIDSFDYSILEGIIPEDEVKNQFNNQNSDMISLISKDGRAKPKDYQTVISDLSKAALFDNVVAKVRELEKELLKEKGKNKGGVPHGGSPKPILQKPRVTSEDPMDFITD